MNQRLVSYQAWTAACRVAVAIAVALLATSASPAGTAVPDPRHIANGWPIPSEGYVSHDGRFTRLCLQP